MKKKNRKFKKGNKGKSRNGKSEKRKNDIKEKCR